MLFYSIIYRLSDDLPWLLDHNVNGTLHLGDFVLPFFLFTTGLALNFMSFKPMRWAKMLLVWFVLSPFSSGTFLGMDEVMLNAILSFILFFFVSNDLILYFILFAMLFIYPYVELSDAYLGGYPSVIFYSTVVIAGILTGKNMDRPQKMLFLFLILSILSLFFYPPHKMTASPSFMFLSALFSISLFSIIHHGKIRNSVLEYLGKNSLYYWFMMFVLILIPLIFAAFLIEGKSRFSLPSLEAVIIATFLSMVPYLIMRFSDWSVNRKKLT